jgi:hypothetical protein
MSLPFDQLQNSMEQLGDLVNRVQRHRCNTTYCLTRKKNSGEDCNELACRFYFPHPQRETAVIVKGEEGNPLFYKFLAKRNDEMLNHYNPLITMSWLANTDITCCTGSKAVLNYLGKYVTKSEKKTASYQELVSEILPTVNSRHPLGSVIRKLLNKLVGERDWSAQEINHILPPGSLSLWTSVQKVNSLIDSRTMTPQMSSNAANLSWKSMCSVRMSSRPPHIWISFCTLNTKRRQPSGDEEPAHAFCVTFQSINQKRISNSSRV